MQDTSALGRAVAMVADLRRRCPWDRAQTRETIRPYLVEEVFELDQAIADNDAAAIRDEVADLLLHLAWQLVLAEENAEFTADQVAGDLETKMRRRHPHLFDLGPRERWESLKRRENGGRPRGILSGIPGALPALLLAWRLQERAAAVGFDWPDTAGPLAKVREEVEEVEAALAETTDGAVGAGELSGSAGGGEPAAAQAPDALVEEIGDLLFAVVNLARKARVLPTTALDRANRKFRTRFERVEGLAKERGIDVPTAGLEALDRLWDEVKENGG